MDLENLKNHVRKNENIINRLNEEFEEKENMYNEIAVKLEEKEFEISSSNQQLRDAVHLQKTKQLELESITDLKEELERQLQDKDG